VPECLDAEEEFANEVVVVSQELGWVVEEELADQKERGKVALRSS